jgi:NAD(P)-dependent dehydrogenase (short-subunit alcohol dehydrogenase family)
MRPILVTGGAGFIGSHTCKALVAHGLQPIAFDNLSRGHREMVRWGRLVVGAGLESVLYEGEMRAGRGGDDDGIGVGRLGDRGGLGGDVDAAQELLCGRQAGLGAV